MGAQTLTLAGKRYVLLPAAEYEQLSRRNAAAMAEDRRDAKVLNRRLKEMRRRGEKPVPYSRARQELGLK